MRTLILLGFCVFYCLTSYTQTVSTDRPTQAFGTATISKSTFQLETGLGLDVYPMKSFFTVGFNQFRYGVTDIFELRSGFGITQDVSNNSWSGFNISGLKVKLIDKKVQLSLLSEAFIPASSDPVSWYNAILLSHNISEKINFGYMLLHNYDFGLMKATSYYGNAQFSWVSNFNLVDKLTFFAEVSLISDLMTTNIDVYVDAGFMYLINDQIQLDLFFGQGVNFQRGSYGMGFAYLFK